MEGIYKLTAKMIKVENLTKSFDDVRAVDGLSFEVEKGDIVGLLGPNGAGKTTTMRLISGYLFPDKGSISIAGFLVSAHTREATELRRYIGYLPENNPLYKDMLVSELLNFSAELKKIPKNKRRPALDFVVHAVKIGDVFYRPIGELSKGYRQRVGMALALLHQPDILIMDEPTEGLDPNQRTEIRALIRELAKNRTIIISTHVMQEASAMCNRIIIINKGKLVADGTTEELSRAARHEKILILEVEGSGVEFSLRTLAGVDHIDITSIEQNKFRAKVITAETIELRPSISKLARENHWTIWQLIEEKHTLEDIFHKLTSET